MDQKDRIIKVRNLLRDLRTIVRRQPLNEWLGFLSSLNFSNNRVWNIFNERTENNPELRKAYRIFIPSLAKYSISNSNDNVGTTNREFEAAYRDVHESINKIIEVKDWLPAESIENPEEAFNCWSFLIANQQNIFQEYPINVFARCFWLYKKIIDEITTNLNISTAIESIYGLALNRLWLITANIIGKYKGGFQKFDKIEPTDSESIEESLIYFNRFSVSYAQFSELALDNNFSLTGESTQFYGFSPFDLYPIISTKRGFIVICPYYLVRRFYIPMYFDLLDHFQESDNPKNNPFSTLFGKVFEIYVGKQLEFLNDGAEILTEFEYDKDLSKKFCDFTLIYNDSAIFIEVKKSLLPIKEKFNLERTKLKDSLGKSLAYGIQQINRKIQDTKDGMAGLERFSAIKHYYGLVITFDDSYQLNGGFIRSIIDEILSENNVQLENNWQIMTIRELENFVTVCSDENTFLSLLKAKLNDEKLMYMDFDDFLRNRDIEILENELITQVIRDELEALNSENNE